MNVSRPIAIGIALLGLVLLIAGPLIPGGERLVRNAPVGSGHVTDLALADDGSILAGTEHGELWRLSDHHWRRVNVDLGDHPVTALSADLAGDASKGPIGTGGGLVNAPTGMPPLNTRISDEIMAGERLIVATGDGLQVQADGAWQPALQGTYIYRLERQDLDGRSLIHAGTVDAGVYTADANSPLDWQPNDEGLPPQANVFSFVLTEAGNLIAGTDKGLFWQSAPMQPWQRLKIGLESSRMLSLYAEPTKAKQAERLWIGSDDGLWRVEIDESAGAPEALAYAELIQAPPEYINYPVSWIIPYETGVMLSAGSVYQFGNMGLAGWYWVSLGGLILLLLGGWLLPNRHASETASA